MDLILNTTAIKRLIYLLLINFVCFYSLTILNDKEAYWLVWIAVLLTLNITGDSFWQRTVTIFITGLLTAVLVITVGRYANFYITCLVSTIVIFILSLISQYYPRYFVSVFIISLLILISVSFPVNWQQLNLRYNYLILGALITVMVHFIFLTNYYTNELNYAFIQCLTQLRDLNKEIFATLLEPHYKTQLYLFERRLHMQKNNYIRWIDRLRVMSCLNKAKNKTKNFKWDQYHHQLNNLYDVLLDYSQLRYRLSDYSTLELCRSEMTALFVATDTLFYSLTDKALSEEIPNFLQALNEQIKRFEENFLHVLQVSAADPMVFLLFIASIKNLRKHLEDFYSKILAETN